MQGLPGNWSETQIIDAFHEGKEQIFKAIFTTYYDALFHFCHEIIGHRQEAEDIVTESFVKLYEHKQGVESIDNLRGLLYVTAKNLCLNYLRNIKRRRQHHQKILHTLQTLEDSIVSYIVKAEYRRELHQAIALLPPQRQTIINELIINGKTVREVAEQLNIGEGYVHSAKSKALATLKEILNKSGALFLFVLLYIALNIIQLIKKILLY